MCTHTTPLCALSISYSSKILPALLVTVAVARLLRPRGRRFGEMRKLEHNSVVEQTMKHAKKRALAAELRRLAVGL